MVEQHYAGRVRSADKEIAEALGARPDELERRIRASLDALGPAHHRLRQAPRGGYSSKLATRQDRDASRTSVASPTHSLKG